MYRSETSLPALLSSREYTSEEAHRRDSTRLRDGTWQLVACTSALSRPGDYVSTERLGVPLLVRNHEGTLTAVQNVCAHRQCRLVSQATGHADELKCPYHGWRYGGDGRTRKLPGASNFPHFDRDRYCLPVYPVRVVGQLVFVQLSGNESSECDLDRWDDWRDEFADRTNPDRWRLVLSTEFDYDCDWKIPIEGSLESYHLDEIHSGTLGDDPGESETDHQFLSSGTTFETDVRESSFLARMEERTVRAITGEFSPDYRHVHVFPNVMASFTGTMSLVYQIHPTACGKSRMTVFGFVCRSRRMGIVGEWIGRGLGRAARDLAIKVLAEDAAIFPEVQAGMRACRVPPTGAQEQSERPRIFGRCEERLHAFHEHWFHEHWQKTNDK